MGGRMTEHSRSCITYIDALAKGERLERKQLLALIGLADGEARSYLFKRAREVSRSYYGNEVYARGLVEVTNHCKNDCFYCGIRKGNAKVHRYQLTFDEIMNAITHGYELGFHSFVLQGGETDGDDELYTKVVAAIREGFPDCAITLSLGEKSDEFYEEAHRLGADRYLLRHETANPNHYAKLHPKVMTLDKRVACIRALKRIGYAAGTGFMVGSPFQTDEDLCDDLLLIAELEPAMIGIGPFLPQHDTPFGNRPSGTLEKSLVMIALLRLMNPKALIPASTALGSVDPEGRERGVLAGANVVMPNLSPYEVRGDYALYDNKVTTGAEAAESLHLLREKMNAIGYTLVTGRGDPAERAKR